MVQISKNLSPPCRAHATTNIKPLGSVTVDESQDSRVDKVELDLRERYGAEISGADLRRLLGYKTPEAFRQAAHRGKLPVATYQPAHRRRRCASARALAIRIVSLDEIDRQQRRCLMS